MPILIDFKEISTPHIMRGSKRHYNKIYLLAIAACAAASLAIGTRNGEHDT